jgi:hypothetical protein
VRIPLTHKQVDALRPYFDKVRSTRGSGRPGMLVAQLRWSSADGAYWMEPGWLEHEVAALIEQRGREVDGAKDANSGGPSDAVL